jgi:hypothetical protein
MEWMEDFAFSIKINWVKATQLFLKLARIIENTLRIFSKITAEFLVVLKICRKAQYHTKNLHDFLLFSELHWNLISFRSSAGILMIFLPIYGFSDRFGGVVDMIY